MLQEIDNTASIEGDSSLESRDLSMEPLVEALNADSGAGMWDYVPSPLPADQAAYAEQDVNPPAFIYQPSALTTVKDWLFMLVGSAAFSNAREPEAMAFSSVTNPDY